MSFRFSPKIVTDGLILYCDGANPQSYISGDTICNDLSITQSTGTLENGVTYDTDNNGSWVFDGLDDYIDFSDTTLDLERTDAFSFSSWVYADAFEIGTINAILSKYSNPPARGYHYSVFKDPVLTGGNPYLRFDLQNNGGLNGIIVWGSTTLSTSMWYNFTVTYNGSSDASGTTLYVNGVAESLYIRYDTLNATINSAKTFKIGGIAIPAFRIWNGKIPIVKVYNKELSVSEVLQNYNAMKSRFGL